MTSGNEHVNDYLNYYCDFAHAPNYAVLIKGPWGCGKTHLVKKFFSNRNLGSNDGRNGKNHLYVSLYGITEFEQIEDAFFRQLHPKLSSKGMKLAAAIAKGLLKTAIKIDIDTHGQAAGTVTAQIPEIDLPSYLSDAKDRILVFDDLERCGMPIKDVLGYINSFVEHDDCRVLLIADEDRIIDKEHDDYLSRKEKLIGKTFEVRPEFQDALAQFISLVDDENVTYRSKWGGELDSVVY